MTVPSLLPPNSTPAERALEQAMTSQFAGASSPISDLWNPLTCPPTLLPFLAWGLSIDIWDTHWSEATKRAAIADAIAFQRRKGTPASLRMALDRIDPAIGMTEWFDDPDLLAPYTFRLELPLNADTAIEWTDDLVLQLLRDIEMVKPVRAHFEAVHHLASAVNAWLVSGMMLAGFDRYEMQSDEASALDPVWGTYLQTEDGEPLAAENDIFLESA